MAQLLLIKAESLSNRDNRQVDDLVGVYEDSHVFSEHEKKIFRIVQVPHTKQALELQMPRVQPVSRTQGWAFEGDVERKVAWQDSDGAWKEVKVRPALELRYELGALVNNYSRYAENKEVTLIEAK